MPHKVSQRQVSDHTTGPISPARSLGRRSQRHRTGPARASRLTGAFRATMCSGGETWSQSKFLSTATPAHRPASATSRRRRSSSVARPRHAASPARASGWSKSRPWEPCQWEVCPRGLWPRDTGRSQVQPVQWRTVGHWPDGRSLAGTLPIGTESDSSLQPARRNSRCPGSAWGPIRPVAVPSH